MNTILFCEAKTKWNEEEEEKEEEEEEKEAEEAPHPNNQNKTEPFLKQFETKLTNPCPTASAGNYPTTRRIDYSIE